MPLPGFKRLPGKANRYVDPSGKEISRRQYENIRFRKSGWKSWSEYQRTARATNPRTGRKDYRRWAEAYADEKGISVRNAMTDPDFMEAYNAAKDTSWKHDPDGEFADFLKLVGLRPDDADYNVGDTP